MTDLFASNSAASAAYTADSIEVLEGLEPVRRRPGMYIGGTDERALHHLFAEVLDNAMDEAVAGHASRIEVALSADGALTVTDNGRGIPVDDHPKFPGKSALEVILTTLHSGGKFSSKAYQTAGGLHGVGISVVNALAETLVVEVARDKQLYRQTYSRGLPLTALEKAGAVANRRGTLIRFIPDEQIFGAGARFSPGRLFKMAKAKAYLHKGVEIRWRCDASLIAADSDTPAEATLHFAGGIAEYLDAELSGRPTLSPVFKGEATFPDSAGRMEWAIAWLSDEESDSSVHSYVNTIPTPQGGSHESGLRTALTRALKGHAERVGNKRASILTAEDAMGAALIMLSVFIREPQFQGQTKEKLATPEAARLVDAALKDRFDQFLAADPKSAEALIEALVLRAEERARRRKDKETKRQSATRRLRLPGKLAECSRTDSEDTEIFIVEGDSAGGSAKQARNRETQAILPLRGKILNVASASADKKSDNRELADLALALGCGSGRDFDISKLRYERVILMTDADVDGAHIASLLITFFYRDMPGLVRDGRLFLAQPPLYRLVQGGKSHYARDDAHKDWLMGHVLTGRGKIEISRFKGLGEMPAAQLKETTMDPARRSLLRVQWPVGEMDDGQDFAKFTAHLIERLMGRKPEERFRFIQDNARFVEEVDV